MGWNEHLYGKTKEERLAKKTQEVDFPIWHMHTVDRKQVHPSDKHLFHMSAEQRITQSIDRKHQWIECVTIAYEQASLNSGNDSPYPLNSENNNFENPRIRTINF